MFLHLKKESVIEPFKVNPMLNTSHGTITSPLLDEVHGQDQAKRALMIAASGHHNLLLSGSHGSGKTMLAKVLVNLLPSLGEEEMVATTKLYSLAGENTDEIITSRPFRSPHHTASRISLIGGGSRPKPGEISLAHLGVLFLDEILEYPRTSVESLRQPMEDKKISVSRIEGHATYPADFMLVATMNPCPCGYYGDSIKECSCTSNQILAYQKKLSGPLLDRIDLSINVVRVANNTILDHKSLVNLQHSNAQKQIEIATKIQIDRYGSSIKYNFSMTNSDIRKYAPLSDEAKIILSKASDRLGLSARSFLKVIKIARTIADLSGEENIFSSHIGEALQYRN